MSSGDDPCPTAVAPADFYGSSSPRRSPRTLIQKASSKEPIIVSDSSDDGGILPPEKDDVRSIYNINISEKELSCLEGNKCLNDAVINSYLDVLAIKIQEDQGNPCRVGHTNTFFIDKLKRDGYDAAKDWSGIDGVKLNETYKHFLIPVETGFHWILIEINFVDSYINVYDSLGKRGSSSARLVADFLKRQGIAEKFHIRWPSVPKQTNYHDCGVFLLQYAEMIYENIPINRDSFSQRDAKQLRTKFFTILVSAME